MSSPDIADIINDSLYSDKALFVLSANEGEAIRQVHELLINAWDQAQSNTTTPHVRNLSMRRVGFPWLEHPPHALYTNIMEVRDIREWEAIVGNALLSLYEKDRNISPNTQINAILECMTAPSPTRYPRVHAQIFPWRIQQYYHPNVSRLSAGSGSARC